MSIDAADRERALVELSRRAIDGAPPETIRREGHSALTSEMPGDEAARSFADQLATIVLDPARELQFSGDPRARDMLELVRAARRRIEQLDIRLERYRTLFAHASDGICVVDRDGSLVEMNARGCEMLGYTEEELLALRISDVIVPDDAPLDLAALRTGRPVIRRRSIRRKDGSQLLAEIGSRLLPDGRMIGTFREVGEDAPAERELREWAQRFRQALRAARAGAWEWDIRTNEAFWSEETYRLMGLEPRSGRESYEAWIEHVHHGDRERVQAAIARAATEGADLDVELRVVRSDGTTRWFRDVGKMVTDAEGQPVRMYGIQIDIHESKQSELARASAESQLQQAERMEAIGRLAGGVAHDFNNLLTVILTATEIVTGLLSDDHPAAEHLDAIREAGSRGAAVTRQLLTLSRRHPVARRALDVSAQIRQMAPMLRRLLGEDIAIEMALAADLPVVRMDSGQLDQIVLNLACNGRDAMPRGGTLSFTTGEDEVGGRRHVVITVADTGGGMDEETRARVFEPFFTTKPPGTGTGLGLATVYSIVAQNDGRIDVVSAPETGTCFRLWLPVAGADPASARAPRGTTARRATGASVLVVEDERAVRRLVRRVLESEGHRVLEAADGEEALELARTSGETFDLVLTDVVMPSMSGTELAARLHAELPDVRVVFMSGYVGDALARHGLSGDVTLLNKPFTPVELIEHVARALERAHSPRRASTSSS